MLTEVSLDVPESAVSSFGCVSTSASVAAPSTARPITEPRIIFVFFFISDLSLTYADVLPR